MLLRKKCDHLGVLTFGAEFDALRCLPQLQIERQTPGVLNKVKRNGNPPQLWIHRHRVDVGRWASPPSHYRRSLLSIC